MNREAGENEWKAHWGLASELGLSGDRVAVSAYASPGQFEAERERIFGKAWLLCARVEEVPEPGSFIRREVPPLRTEALITRGKDGHLHAFHNACLHRGSALVAECSGKASAFTCPYHGWTYGIDGKLRGIPGKEYFPQVDLATARLKPIHMDVWNGFVFLNFSAAPDQSLAEFLGPFASQFDGLPLADYPRAIEMTLDVDVNWKAFLEASNESYHVSALHGRTLGEQMTTSANPRNNSYDPVFSGAHASATVEGRTDWLPTKPVARFVAETPDSEAGMGNARRDAPDEAATRPFAGHAAVNRIGLPSFAAECMLIFPFTCLQLLPNSYVWFQYWPVSHDRTRFVWRQYVPSAPRTWRQAFAEAHAIAYVRDVVTEDGTMVARQQRGFEGGGLAEVVFGENEFMPRFFHQTVRDWLAGA